MQGRGEVLRNELHLLPKKCFCIVLKGNVRKKCDWWFLYCWCCRNKEEKMSSKQQLGQKNGKFFFENTCTLFMFLILDNVLSDKKQILTQVQK